jgi:hypothetical protein
LQKLGPTILHFTTLSTFLFLAFVFLTLYVKQSLHR